MPTLISLLASMLPLLAASIPGIFNTGVDNAGALLANSAVDPHYRLVQSADAGTPGPNAIVVIDTLFPIVTGPWLPSGPGSKWIGPKADQSVGSAAGDYKYRLTFDLTGLEPATAVITGRWSSDNAGAAILLNGVTTGITYDGNFGAFSAPFTITTDFIDGTNTLDFVVNNAGTVANPTAFRAELSGTADAQPPPGTPPAILQQPAGQTNGLGESATFNVRATGSRPLFYQWRFNGGTVANATNSSLTLNFISSANAGDYDVIVSNASGSVTSAPAMLAVVVLSPAQLSYEGLGPASRRTGLTFSEIMYHPTNRVDGRNLEFIELYNSNPFPEDMSGYRLSGDVDYLFPNGTSIPALGFLVVAASPADVQAVHGISGVLGPFTNNLPNNSGTVRLRKRSNAIVLEMTYADQPPWPVAADGAGHSLVLARASYGTQNPKAWAAGAMKGGSPGADDPVPAGLLENVVINEVLAHTDLPLLDFIELHNHSTVPVEISGCFLSDDPETNRFQIPTPTIIAPGGFVSFDEAELGFALAADGETVYFMNPAQTRVLDAVRFGGQANAVSIGRYPDGADAWQSLTGRTPGTNNAAPPTRDVVINEIMYHPLTGLDDDQFVELHNRGVSPVNLGGWRLTDGVAFTFPSNATVAGGGYIVVAKNTSRLLTNYPALNPARLFGNFSGKLSHGGERIALAMPDAIVQTNATNFAITTNTFFIVMDEVTYGDGGRWGRWSDGGGSSLELIDARADHRLAPNWADSNESTNAPWTIVQATGVLDLGHPSQTAADQLQIMLQGAGEALVDDVEVLVSGANRVANGTFEAGIAGWSFQGTHRLSSWETNGGYNSARSLHLRASDRGDHVANRARVPLSPTIPTGTTNVTIRAKVRWLAGHPEVLMRLKGGFLEAAGRLATPASSGTPGARNSRAATNAGPAIVEVSHRPVLPQADQAIRVMARVVDPDGAQNVTLRYRLDPATNLTAVAMADNGRDGDALAGDGIYTGAITGQATGTLIAFQVEATDGFSPPATTRFPHDAPVRECLVRVGEAASGGTFGTYRFWITAATHTLWSNREKMSNEALDATFVYGTNRVVYNAGACYSGSSYTAPIYTTPTGALCGYNLFFPSDDLVLGGDHFTLDWPIRDDTNQREQLMYWFLEQYGLPNNHRRYVNLFVNGVKRGAIYDDVQQPDGDMLEEWFPGDSDGALYKTDCWNEFGDAGDRIDPCILNTLETFNTTGGVKKAARYRWNWRPRATQETANEFDPLFDLVDAVNATGGGYVASVECVADVDHWMRTFAMNDLASFWDAFGNPNGKNTYLYKPRNDKWKLMCWDFDVGLGVFNDPTTAALFDCNDSTVLRMYNNARLLRPYWTALDEAVNGFFQTGPGTALDTILDTKYAAFQANGIALAGPAAIKTWISQRRSFLQTQLATVAAAFSVTGTNSFSVATNLVTLTGRAPVSVRTILINGVEYAVTWTNVTTWIIRLPVATGTNVLNIQGLDRFGNAAPGAAGVVTVNFTGLPDAPEDSVVINEIMYNPQRPEASYVELFNRSATTSFDLAGWRLDGVGFTFPPGSIIAGGQYLVVAKNWAAFARAYGTPVPLAGFFSGQLDDGGETLTLLRPSPVPGQELVVDRVTYDDDPPWLATPDGQGASLQLIDASQDNNRVSNWSDGTGWKFFSFTNSVGTFTNSRLSFYVDTTGGDIYVDDIALVQGSVPGVGSNYVANGDFESALSPPWFRGPLATNTAITTSLAHSGNASLHFIVNPGGIATTTFYEDLARVTTNTIYTLSFWYLPGTATNLYGRLSTAYRPIAAIKPSRFTPGATNSGTALLPAYPLLWLSEVQPHNLTGILDGAGDPDPWIELFNAGTNALSLDGCFLSAGYGNLREWNFPSNAVINPGEFLLVWGDGEPGESTAGEFHTGFRLNPTNGSVALSRGLGANTQILDYFNYTGVGADQSYGAFPDGQGSYRRLFYFPTPGTTNNPASPPVVVFINEWMAANLNAVADAADGAFDDWFELFNPATNPIDLSGYTLTDTLANPAKHTIPPGIRIPAQGFLLVWADEQSSQTLTNGDLHVSFKLSQGGEAIALFAPDGRLVDSVTFGPQTNNISHGRWPDGHAAPLYFMTTPTPRAANVIPVAPPAELRIVSVTLDGTNSVALTWSAQPGRSYRVQFKNSLDDAMWNDLPGDVPAAAATAAKTDDTVGGRTQRFYRILRLD